MGRPHEYRKGVGRGVLVVKDDVSGHENGSQGSVLQVCMNIWHGPGEAIAQA
jgi:hypothetical protein